MKSLLTTLFLILASAQSTVAETEMILSKDHASQMFMMTRTQWNENVKATTLMGVSEKTGKPESGYGMITAHPSGFMIVNPDYSNKSSPDFIQVTIGYRKPNANNLSTEKLKAVVAKAKSELAPEFNVTGGVEELDGGKGIFFMITK